MIDYDKKRHEIEFSITYSAILEEIAADEGNGSIEQSERYRDLFNKKGGLTTEALVKSFEDIQREDSKVTENQQERAFTLACAEMDVGEFVIFSEREFHNDRKGFWSNEQGWVDLQSATHLSAGSLNEFVFTGSLDVSWLEAIWLNTEQAKKKVENYEEGSVMKDKAFLQFIHDRMKNVHGENENFDYMLKLQAIIDAMDPEVLTPNVTQRKPGM